MPTVFVCWAQDVMVATARLFPTLVQQPHTARLKSALVGIFIAQKLTNQSFFSPGERLLNIYPVGVFYCLLKM